MKMKKTKNIFFALTAGLLVGCGNAEDETSTEEEASEAPAVENEAEDRETERGGTLDIAYSGTPPTLDPHITITQSTRDVARHIFEPLVALNENFEVEPVLAEDFTVSDDGLTYTFTLPEDVTFHNGEPLEAEDVVASMEKWMEYSSPGRANFSDAEMVEVDSHTVEMNLNESSLVAPFILSEINAFPAIMPQEIAEEAGPEGAGEIVGTGPYKLEEWNIDQYAHLVRFEDYAEKEEEASGLVGKKEALLDEIFFHYVSDESIRVNGMITGEYDIAFSLPTDNVEQIEQAEGVSLALDDGGMMAYNFNKKEGHFADQTLRQAFTLALDPEEILIAAYTDERFYELDPGLALPTQEDWHSDAGSDIYYETDEEAARELVEESDYDGGEVTIVTTRDYPERYNAAVVAQQTLENIGVQTSLEVYDWPTLQNIQNDEENYNFDMYIASFATRPTPHQQTFLDSRGNHSGWPDSEEIDRLLDEIKAAPSMEEAQPLIDELHEENWSYLSVSKIGNFQSIAAIRDDIEGYEPFVGPVFWNTSINE